MSEVRIRAPRKDPTPLRGLELTVHLPYPLSTAHLLLVIGKDLKGVVREEGTLSSQVAALIPSLLGYTLDSAFLRSPLLQSFHAASTHSQKSSHEQPAYKFILMNPYSKSDYCM